MSMEEEQDFPVGPFDLRPESEEIRGQMPCWGYVFLKIRTLAADWEPPDNSSYESSDRMSLYHFGRRTHLFSRLTERGLRVIRLEPGHVRPKVAILQTVKGNMILAEC